MVADDRIDDVDEGWADRGDGAQEPAPSSDEPPDAADKIDTAKSRVVRLVERPPRTDGDDKGASPPSDKTVPPPADYDVVRKTSKNQKFDLDAALKREAATKADTVVVRAEEPAPEIPAPAPLPTPIEISTSMTPAPEEPIAETHAADRSLEEPREPDSFEDVAPPAPRGRGAVMIAGASAIAIALVAAAFALRPSAEQSSRAPTVTAPSTTVAVTAEPPSTASPSPSVIASVAPAPVTTSTTTSSTTSPSVLVPGAARPKTSALNPAASPAPPIAASSPAKPTAPAVSTTTAAAASAKSAPGIEFLKRDL